jgi:membrane protease YdiL (CAAX protease family)
MPHSQALAVTVVLLAVVNLLNNRIAPRAYVATSVVASGALLLLADRAGLAWADVGLTADGSSVVWALAGLTVVATGNLVAALVPATRAGYADRRFVAVDGRRAAYQVLVRIPLGTVLLEELAFRGVIYGLANAAWGVVAATVVSSVLFGLWHILPSLELVRLNALAGRTVRGRAGLAAAGAVLATALAGVLLCELRRHSGGLLAPAAVHWATNGLGFLTGFLLARRTRRRGADG